MPLIGWLSEINMTIPLPDFLMRSEEVAALIIDHFFDSPGIGRFMVNMLMIALIPAIGEELFFRGIIQQYLSRGLKSIHLAVIITAFIFSFFHFQFQGFIPRMGLGILFGYLMIWSRSVWLPVLAHFINNGSAVVIEFLNKRDIIPIGYHEFGDDPAPVTILVSAVCSLGICYLIYRTKPPLEVIKDYTIDLEKEE